MRRTILFLLVILYSSALMACSNNEEVQTRPSFQIKESNQEPTLNTEPYYSPDHGEKSVTEDTITWNQGGVTLLAKKTKTSIESITIQKGNQNQSVAIMDKPYNISSVAVSADGEYLAISLYYQNVGNNVILISLSNGKQIILNDQTGESFIETIHTFNWSPKEDILAFAYGNTGSSKIGFYNAVTNTFETIPGEYITTQFILWNKEGDILDFISEKPADRFTLYRYSLNNTQVETVEYILQKDLVKFYEFVPEYLNK
ncbi:hypothetical protein [Paenibacillus wynnii]|uniref:hypothetical protein n=1 Tax=Paenibacillus wynnii TaxID=268407 RepID=UPI00278CBB36|nr:hypothetical protein [Paenibacillus wynnii]MDQ0194717.1 hypothetical protein [Paenibacillus wynnii]